MFAGKQPNAAREPIRFTNRYPQESDPALRAKLDKLLESDRQRIREQGGLLLEDVADEEREVEADEY